MMSIKCSSLIPRKCTYIAEGETGEDAKHALIEHLVRAHPDVVSMMSIKARLYLDEEMDEMLAFAK